MSKTLFPSAERQKRNVDIVFCIDVTNSMQPVIDGLKSNIKGFLIKLQKDGVIEARLALVAYRNKHDKSPSQAMNGLVCDEPWVIKNFTSDISEFINWLNEQNVQAFGGGIEEPYGDPLDDPESTLDALYIAIHEMNWRESETHRSIVLFTDSGTYKTLHPTTYGYPDNGIGRVIQDFQTMKHASLFMCVPEFEEYKILEKSLQQAERLVIAKFLRRGSESDGLKNVDMAQFLEMISTSITQTVPVEKY